MISASDIVVQLVPDLLVEGGGGGAENPQVLKSAEGPEKKKSQTKNTFQKNQDFQSK